MIILITSEMNITDYEFNLTSWSLFSSKKTKGIRQKTFYMLDYVYLQMFECISLNRIYVTQWDKQD